MEIRMEVARRRSHKWEEVAEKLYAVQQQRRAIVREEAQLMDKLKELSGYGAAMGKKFLLSVSLSKGSINYSAIPQLKKIDLEPFRKESVPMWKLRKLN